jgi:hypothetical protein
METNVLIINFWFNKDPGIPGVEETHAGKQGSLGA